MLREIAHLEKCWKKKSRHPEADWGLMPEEERKHKLAMREIMARHD